MSTTNPTASAPREVVNPDVSCPGAPPSNRPGVGHNSGLTESELFRQAADERWSEIGRPALAAADALYKAADRDDASAKRKRADALAKHVEAAQALYEERQRWAKRAGFRKWADGKGIDRNEQARMLLVGEFYTSLLSRVETYSGWHPLVSACEVERDRQDAARLREEAEAARKAEEEEEAGKKEDLARSKEKKVKVADTVAEIKKADPCLTRKEAEKKAARRVKEEDREAARAAAVAIAPSLAAPVHHCAVADLHQHVEAGSVDAIVTDPPYLREFIPVYGDLARFAVHALRPGGLLLAMAGHPYTFEIGDLMRLEGLRLRWIVAYFQPSASQIVHSAKVSVHWKPIVVLHKEGGTSPDDYSSDWIDKGAFKASDKDAHLWGQSVQGMGRLMREWVKEPGSLVCDPFCGAGSTLVAARALGHRVIGADIDEGCVNDTRGALAESAGVGAWPEAAPRDRSYYDTDRPRRPRGPPPGLGLRLLERRRGRAKGIPAALGEAA